MPKPFIPIMGNPMFVSSVKSFPSADKQIFVCLADFTSQYNFDKEARRYFPDSEIVIAEQVTEGQACSCLLAKSLMDPNESLLISSIDYQVVYDQATYQGLIEDSEIDVIIWTFSAGIASQRDPKSFAYCRTEGAIVTEIVEKQTISNRPELDPAVVGTFYYRKVEDFVWASESMINNNVRVNGEYYVGTSINQLIDAGKRVVIFPVEKFISFGFPFELELFHFWEEYFFNLSNHPYKG